MIVSTVGDIDVSMSLFMLMTIFTQIYGDELLL